MEESRLVSTALWVWTLGPRQGPCLGVARRGGGLRHGRSEEAAEATGIQVKELMGQCVSWKMAGAAEGAFLEDMESDRAWRQEWAVRAFSGGSAMFDVEGSMSILLGQRRFRWREGLQR